MKSNLPKDTNLIYAVIIFYITLLRFTVADFTELLACSIYWAIGMSASIFLLHFVVVFQDHKQAIISHDLKYNTVLTDKDIFVHAEAVLLNPLSVNGA